MIYSIVIGLLCTVFYFLLDTILTQLIDYKLYLFTLARYTLIKSKRRLVRFVMNNRAVKRLRAFSRHMLPGDSVAFAAAQAQLDRAKLGNFKMFEFVRVKIAKRSEYTKMLATSDLIDKSEHARNSVPKKRSGHRCVCNEENLWIWGGYCPLEELSDNDNNEEEDELTIDPSPIFPELWRFNFSTRRWSLLRTTGDIPDKTVASHGAVLHGNSTLVVFGGTGYPFGENLSNALYICNLNTLVWKKFDLKEEVPEPLYGSSLVLIDDHLYVLFGTNAQIYMSNVYRINIRTLVSKKLFDSVELLQNADFTTRQQLDETYPDEFLLGRYRQECVVYNNKIYVFGGGKLDGDSYPMDNLPVFNLETNAWEFTPTHPDSLTNTYPEKRKFHSCHLIDDSIYMFGGMHTDASLGLFRLVENCVWKLNMAEMRWIKMSHLKMPCLTSFHASCSNNKGQIYFHGGVKSMETRHSRSQRINHLYTILLQVPRLSDICWTKLIANYPKLLCSTRQTLVDIGVPANFIKRIN